MRGHASCVPRTPIWIRATGARTPVGLCSDSAAAAVRAGISALAEHPLLVDQDGEPMRLASDAFLAPETPIVDRMTQLLVSALEQLPDLWLRPDEIQTLLLVCAPEPRPGLPAQIANTLGRAVLDHFGARAQVQQLPLGHAAGLLGFGVGAKALEDGAADVAVVAAVDSYYDPDTLEWMDTTGQLKSEANRDGFFPGEAAGACLLSRGNEFHILGLPPLARLTAISTAVEPITIRSEEVCVGKGLSAAFLGLAPVIEQDGRQITDTYCDLNGHRHRSEELLYTILRTQQLFVDAHAYLHPADCWGDIGAASGPLLAVLAIAAGRKAYANGSRAALWASSEGGRRAIALLDLPGPRPAA
jgi:3-oxoacyl-[acyl-carrier-protein] synthase-1